MTKQHTLGMLEAYIKTAQNAVHDLANANVVHNDDFDKIRLDKISEFSNFLGEYLHDVLEESEKDEDMK